MPAAPYILRPVLQLARDAVAFVWQSGHTDSVESFRTYRRLPWRMIARDPATGRLTAAVSADAGRTWEILTRQGRFPCPGDPRTWPDRTWQNRPF